MAEKKETTTYFSLCNEVKAGKFQPIYVLHGEEPYYIDKLSELIVNTALTEDERDFNLQIFYGNDAQATDVINSCKQFPMFAEHRVVVLREAQLIPKQGAGHKDDLNLFQFYADHPLESTILVICHKGGKISAKKFTDSLKQNKSGVVMESAKVKNDSRDLMGVIHNYCTSLNMTIDNKSMAMLSEFIGNDLSRLFGELDKLRILLGDSGKGITPELIEKNIGISKDFNTFELQDALRTRNAVKAYRIIDYFEKNPKNNPLPPIISILFTFFANVLVVRATKDKSTPALLEATGTKSTWQLSKFQEAANNYSTQACVNIIGYLRECDVKSKGMGSLQDGYDLLRELVYKILHS